MQNIGSLNLISSALTYNVQVRGYVVIVGKNCTPIVAWHNCLRLKTSVAQAVQIKMIPHRRTMWQGRLTRNEKFLPSVRYRYAIFGRCVREMRSAFLSVFNAIFSSIPSYVSQRWVIFFACWVYMFPMVKNCQRKSLVRGTRKSEAFGKIP